MKFFSTLLLTILLSGLGPCPARAQDEVGRKAILYINSYHNGYAWSDQVLEGLRTTMDKSGVPYDLQIEYMDSKRFVGNQMEETLYNLYKIKYQNVTFDSIIVSDDNAFQFMLKYQDRLFPGVPVVFCGVNDFEPSYLTGRTNFTGVVELPDIMTNFRLAMHITPDLKRMVVISDRSLTGQAIRKQIITSVQPLANELRIDYWEVDSLPELLKRCEELTEKDIVFLIPIYLESGRIYSVEEVLQTLYKNIKPPIYSAWQFMLGYGIVGGKLHSGQGEGELAAKLALRVMNGTPPYKIPVVSNFEDPYIFDYNVLSHFGIRHDKLPSDSTFINEPLSFYTINKQIFWIIVSSLLVLVFIMVLLVTSILQKRSVELQIKNQLSFLRILMDTIPLPLSYKGIDGRYLGCNLAFENWFGVTREELVDNSSHALARRTDEAERSLLATPGVLSFETDMLDAKGDHHGVIVSKATYKNARGDVVGIVEAIQDITLRRDAEKALRNSQAMLQTVLNNIPQLVYWKDKDLKFMGVNRSFLDFFELPSADDIVGKRAMTIVSGLEAQTAEDANLRVLNSGMAEHRREWTLQLKGRDPVQLEINIVPLHDDAGQVVGVLGTAEDVTAKLSLERQLLQSQKMEAIGALAGGIAHDFNNILTSIINSTELALMDLPEESETVLDLERTLKAARRGSRLVQQILTFSRPSQEGFMPTDLSEVVHEALAIFTATLPRNITVNERITVHPAIAFADPTQLHQIVMNLCANSFQAMRENGGHMALELDEVAFDETHAELMSLPQGQYLRIRVVDNGPGIPPEILDRIFDPFFTTKPKGEGTGLGLAVVHGIVKSHQGGLKAVSQPGQRTSFEIFLPKGHGLTADRTTATGEPPRMGHEHVLFVEDDEDQLRVIPRVLSLLGYTVTAKSGGAEALEFLATSPGSVEVVVTDFDMPGLSGVDFAEQLDRLLPDLPVILVSGRRSALTAAERAGNIRMVLLKPYNGGDLAKAIGQVLDHGTA